MNLNEVTCHPKKKQAARGFLEVYYPEILFCCRGSMTSALGPEQLVALAIFVSYFLTIFFLFFLIIQSISERHRASVSISWSHVGLALASFACTWYCECPSSVSLPMGMPKSSWHKI
jgi:hypothetical protein